MEHKYRQKVIPYLAFSLVGLSALINGCSTTQSNPIEGKQTYSKSAIDRSGNTVVFNLPEEEKEYKKKVPWYIKAFIWAGHEGAKCCVQRKPNSIQKTIDNID